MTRRIQPSEPTVKRIQATEPAARRLDPQAVADALGGEPCPERVAGSAGPVTLYALRQELLSRRQSSGGRPGIEGTSFRAKIPVGEDDWQRLEALATSLSAAGFSPSAGQVASVLLSLALRSLSTGREEGAEGHAAHTAALAREPAARQGAEESTPPAHPRRCTKQ